MPKGPNDEEETNGIGRTRTVAKNGEGTADPSNTVPTIVAQMRQVQDALKANKLSTKLASQLFELCKKLKSSGKELEEAHRAELDEFFAAIRQANCRESDELGVPCRLKLMEMLELRAMGWRADLSHARYYAKREKDLDLFNGKEKQQKQQQRDQRREDDKSTASLSSTTSSLQNSMDEELHSPPSANTFNGQHSAAAEPMTPSAAARPPTSAAVSGFTPFVPSPNAAPFIPPFPPPTPTNSVGIFPTPPPPAQFLPFPQPPLPFNFYQCQQQPKIAAPSRCFVPNLLEGICAPPMGGCASVPFAYGRGAIRQHQFREEITIRNSDSGKVMGVKGRRVALIEEISKTVISFQKVDPKCKERQLTVIGETRTAIEWAKRLIGETIERNVSPERTPSETELEEKDKSDGISIEMASDGTLKIATEDSSLMEAIREVLDKHLKAKADQQQQLQDEQTTNGIDHPLRQSEPNSPLLMGETPAADEQRAPFAYDRDQLLRIRDRHETGAGLKLPGKLVHRLIACDLFVQ